MAGRRTKRVKALLPEVKAAGKAGRSEEEEHAVRAAADYLAAVVSAATERLDALLDDISRLPANTDPWVLRSNVEHLFQRAAEIGKVGEHRQAQVELWGEGLRYVRFRRGRPRRSGRECVCRCISRLAGRSGLRGHVRVAWRAVARSASSSAEVVSGRCGMFRMTNGCGPSSTSVKNSRGSSRGRSGLCGRWAGRGTRRRLIRWRRRGANSRMPRQGTAGARRPSAMTVRLARSCSGGPHRCAGGGVS